MSATEDARATSIVSIKPSKVCVTDRERFCVVVAIRCSTCRYCCTSSNTAIAIIAATNADTLPNNSHRKPETVCESLDMAATGIGVDRPAAVGNGGKRYHKATAPEEKTCRLWAGREPPLIRHAQDSRKAAAGRTEIGRLPLVEARRNQLHLTAIAVVAQINLVAMCNAVDQQRAF